MLRKDPRDMQVTETLGPSSAVIVCASFLPPFAKITVMRSQDPRPPARLSFVCECVRTL